MHSDAPHDGEAQARSERALAALTGVVVLAAHVRPTAAWPLGGLCLIAALLLCAALAGTLAWRGRTWPAGAALPGALLALFVAWAVGRTFFAEVPTAGAGRATTLATGLAAFWLGAFLARSRVGARGVVWGFAGLIAVLSVHAALQYHLLYPIQLEALRASAGFNPEDSLMEGVAHHLALRRVGSWFGSPNVLCGVLAMGVPPLAAIAAQSGTKGRTAAGGVFLIASYAAYRTDSAGGMLVFALGVALSAGVWFLARRRRTRGGGAAAALVLAAALLLGAASSGDPAPEADGAPRQVETVRQRLFYWRTALAIWAEAPLAGRGLGGYEVHYAAHRIAGADETRSPHNFLLALGAETGGAGLALFALFLAALAHGLARGARAGRLDAWTLGAAGAAFLFLVDSLGDLTFFTREAHWDFCLLAGAAAAGAAPPVRPTARALALAVPAALLALGVFAFVSAPDQLSADRLLTARDWLYAADAESRAGDAHAAREAAREALTWAESAAQAQPGDPRARQQAARALELLGRPAEALAALNRAAAAHPLSASIQADRARALWRLGRRETALEAVAEAIALHPLDATHRLTRAGFLLEAGRREEARAAAQEAAEVAFKPLEKRACEEFLAQWDAEKEISP